MQWSYTTCNTCNSFATCYDWNTNPPTPKASSVWEQTSSKRRSNTEPEDSILRDRRIVELVESRTSALEPLLSTLDSLFFLKSGGSGGRPRMGHNDVEGRRRPANAGDGWRRSAKHVEGWRRPSLSRSVENAVFLHVFWHGENALDHSLVGNIISESARKQP